MVVSGILNKESISTSKIEVSYTIFKEVSGLVCSTESGSKSPIFSVVLTKGANKSTSHSGCSKSFLHENNAKITVKKSIVL